MIIDKEKLGEILRNRRDASQKIIRAVLIRMTTEEGAHPFHFDKDKEYTLTLQLDGKDLSDKFYFCLDVVIDEFFDSINDSLKELLDDYFFDFNNRLEDALSFVEMQIKKDVDKELQGLF